MLFIHMYSVHVHCTLNISGSIIKIKLLLLHSLLASLSGVRYSSSVQNNCIFDDLALALNHYHLGLFLAKKTSDPLSDGGMAGSRCSRRRRVPSNFHFLTYFEIESNGKYIANVAHLHARYVLLHLHMIAQFIGTRMNGGLLDFFSD